MARPLTGTHCRLKHSALHLVRRQYPDVDADALWVVEVVNGGYGREALHLRRVGGACDACGHCMDDHSDVSPRHQQTCQDWKPRRIVVWRCQAVGVPRCEYCGEEGHTKSSATAADCAIIAAEVKANREAISIRMKQEWERRRAEAQAWQAEAIPADDREQGRDADAGGPPF